MECKGRLQLQSILSPVRINRNIMECKDILCALSISSGGPGINRNIMECKGSSRDFMCIWKVVLIETLWNVKQELVQVDTSGIQY